LVAGYPFRHVVYLSPIGNCHEALSIGCLVILFGMLSTYRRLATVMKLYPWVTFQQVVDGITRLLISQQVCRQPP